MTRNLAPSYRPDIDGLRAVAILSVIAFHAFPNLASGGFVGVDVFFVISGYLISTIILGSLKDGHFSFLEFYRRRIKRLFPALVTVLLACLGFGWFVLLPQEYAELGKHVVGGAAFVANLVLWQETGYFDQFTDLKPLLHLWSLGVEEQFYMGWPLLLYLAWRWRLNALKVTIAVAAASFILNVCLVHGHTETAFYSPLTRFWELMLGCMLAYAKLGGSPVGMQYRPAQSALGLLLIIIAVFAISKEYAFPGWWALLPTLGALLLISSGPDTWMHRKILAHPSAVWCGLISYPLYLWHWPLLAYLRIVYPDTPPAIYRIIAVLLAFLLAWLTYRFLERPMRFGKHSLRKVAFLIVAMTTTGWFGFEIYHHQGFPARLPDGIRQFVTTTEYPAKEWRIHSCFIHPEDEQFTDANAGACIEKGNKPLLLLWGDSHGAALYPGIKSLEEEYGFRLAQFTTSSCPPLLTWENPAYPFCKSNNNTVFALIQKLQPAIVLLYANWDDDNRSIAQLKLTLAALKKTYRGRIILVGPTPRWKLKLPGIARIYWMTGRMPPLRMTFRLADRVPHEDTLMQELAKPFGVEYISAYKALCNEDGCLTHGTDKGDDEALMFDGDHLSPAGSRFLMHGLAKELFPTSPKRIK